MYKVDDSVAKIDGNFGVYDGKIKNDSVRYGRNAINNHYGYLNDYTLKKVDMPNIDGLAKLSKDEFDKKIKELDDAMDNLDTCVKQFPPINFELKYSPKGLDYLALMGAAYEELGQKQEVSADELSKNLYQGFGESFTTQALDLNKDGKISLGEYSTSIILSDVLSKETDNPAYSPKLTDANGVITNAGQNKSLAYSLDKNVDIASKTYQAIYDLYNLDKAQEEFLSDSNNLEK